MNNFEKEVTIEWYFYTKYFLLSYNFSLYL